MCSPRFSDSFCIHLHGKSEKRKYSGYFVNGPWETALKEKVPVPSLGRHDQYRGNVTNGPVQCPQGRIKLYFLSLCRHTLSAYQARESNFLWWIDRCGICLCRTYIFLLQRHSTNFRGSGVCTCVKRANDASATEARDGLCVAHALCHLQMYEDRVFLACKDMKFSK